MERGSVWLINLGGGVGHEQQGRRPGLIVSRGDYNRGPTKLVVVLPITSKVRGVRMHYEVVPPEGGLREVSYVMVDQIRSISKDRLIKRWGQLTAATMHEISQRIAILLDF